MTDIIRENKNYEIGFLIKSDSDKEKIVHALKSSQFSLLGNGPLTKIKLAYPIKKENFAFFGYLHFSGEPANIRELNDKLKMDEKVLRFFIIPKTATKEEESKISGQFPSSQQAYFSERQKSQGGFPRAADSQPQPVKKNVKPKTGALSNEALEKKLEEILK